MYVIIQHSVNGKKTVSGTIIHPGRDPTHPPTWTATVFPCAILNSEPSRQTIVSCLLGTPHLRQAES